MGNYWKFGFTKSFPIRQNNSIWCFHSVLSSQRSFTAGGRNLKTTYSWYRLSAIGSDKVHVQHWNEKSHPHYSRKFSSFPQKEKVGKNQQLWDSKNKMMSRTRFLHSRTDFLGSKYSGKAQTKPHTFFGWVSAQQRIHMFDFSFTACQPDLNSFNRKQPITEVSKEGCCHRHGTKGCLPWAPGIGEGEAAGGQICLVPPIKRTPASSLHRHKTCWKKQITKFLCRKNIEGSPALLHKIRSS